MENLAIARVLNEIADLLEIKGENPFRIRAYRTGASAVADCGERVVTLSNEALLDIPGIGKDLAAKIRDIATTGTTQYHQDLLALFPRTILDLLSLQSVGPKTVALLYNNLHIHSIEELEKAASSGALRKLRGMGAKKEQLILKAITERGQYAGRHLLAETHDVASSLLGYLRERAPDAVFEAVGSLRRGVETCGDIDILATGGPPDLMQLFASYKLVERILGQGPTKTSVLLLRGYQADLRLVPASSRGAAMQYFTGSKAHNISLRDRALSRGMKLNEYGLFQVDGDKALAGETEQAVYAALELPWIPPELRENRGEIEAALAGTLPTLITRSDLRGDVHMHTTETDGRDDLDTMALGARERGLEYIAVTDHSQALAMANGLDERRALEHARRIRALNHQLEGITLLAGIECDIRADGTLDLAVDCLAELDLVVASIHSALGQDEAEMTERVLRALECPFVDILGHPTGRLLLRRDPSRLNIERVVDAAAQYGVALEINSLPDRLDLNDVNARLAKQRGVKIVISSDAHSRAALDGVQWGVMVARRAWLEPSDVLNTRSVADFQAGLRRNRTKPQKPAR